MEWTRIAELTPCPTHHLLILDGLIPAARLCPYGLRPSKPERSLCLHALSSFQRTSGVPDARSTRPAALPLTTTGRLQANLPRLREGSQSVNPLYSRVRGLCATVSSEAEGRAFLGTKKSALGFLQEQIVRCLPARVVSCVLPGRQHRTSGARSNRRQLYASTVALVKLCRESLS